MSARKSRDCFFQLFRCYQSPVRPTPAPIGSADICLPENGASEAVPSSVSAADRSAYVPPKAGKPSALKATYVGKSAQIPAEFDGKSGFATVTFRGSSPKGVQVSEDVYAITLPGNWRVQLWAIKDKRSSPSGHYVFSVQHVGTQKLFKSGVPGSGPTTRDIHAKSRVEVRDNTNSLIPETQLTVTEKGNIQILIPRKGMIEIPPPVLKAANEAQNPFNKKPISRNAKITYQDLNPLPVTVDPLKQNTDPSVVTEESEKPLDDATLEDSDPRRALGREFSIRPASLLPEKKKGISLGRPEFIGETAARGLIAHFQWNGMILECEMVSTVVGRTNQWSFADRGAFILLPNSQRIPVAVRQVEGRWYFAPQADLRGILLSFNKANGTVEVLSTPEVWIDAISKSGALSFDGFLNSLELGKQTRARDSIEERNLASAVYAKLLMKRANSPLQRELAMLFQYFRANPLLAAHAEEAALQLLKTRFSDNPQERLLPLTTITQKILQEHLSDQKQRKELTAALRRLDEELKKEREKKEEEKKKGI